MPTEACLTDGKCLWQGGTIHSHAVYDVLSANAKRNEKCARQKTPTSVASCQDAILPTSVWISYCNSGPEANFRSYEDSSSNVARVIAMSCKLFLV